MFKKLKAYDEIVVALINEGMVVKALDFAKDYEVHSMKLSSFVETANFFRNKGEKAKADQISKRIVEIQKVKLIKQLKMCSTITLRRNLQGPTDEFFWMSEYNIVLTLQ